MSADEFDLPPSLAARPRDRTERRPHYCEYCGVCDWNTHIRPHACTVTVYDGPPCVTCGTRTTSGTYGAPGVGRWTECILGHHHGSVRILTPEETY